MKILVITRHHCGLSPTLLSTLAANGLELLVESSSSISAFTAMSIARAVNKQAPSFVLVNTLSDAFAAVSARKIAKEEFKIICAPAPHSSIPTGLAQEVRTNIDAWIFTSELQMQRYPEGLNKTIVIPRTDLDVAEIPSPEIEGPIINAWIGPIDGNKDRLIKAIEETSNATPSCQLIICGTAKAQNVMPAVHRSLAVSHPERTIWTGEKFDLHEVISQSLGIVQAGDMPSALEVAYCQKSVGRRLIQPSQVGEFVGSQVHQNPASVTIGQEFDNDKIIISFINLCRELL